MSDSETKSKMICFRLSAAEYKELEQACRASGYTSVPLFARAATMAFHKEDSGTESGDIQAFSRRIELLKHELDYVVRTFLEVANPGPNKGNVASAATMTHWQ